MAHSLIGFIGTIPKLVCAVAVGIAASASLGSTPARALLINAADTGWYNNSGSHDTGNANYVSGSFVLLQYRSFFVFDLVAAGITQSIVSATLYTDSYDVNGENQLVTLYDYVGSIPDLVGGIGGTGAFADLGSGAVYGNRLFSVSDSYTVTSYGLNQAAIASLNASLNGLFALGAQNDKEGAGTYDSGTYVYGSSGGFTGAVYLDVRFGDAASAVPGPLPIFGAAAAFGYSRKLRQAIRRRSLAAAGPIQ